jgi:heme/copper-type cytochrome/quinol oxidase subunit 2
MTISLNESNIIDWDSEKFISIFGKGIKTRYDNPEPWGLFFQDNATPQMEALEELHNNIMFYLAIIMFSVTWIFFSIILNYTKSRISNKYMNHGTLVELIWTITPPLNCSI